MIGVRSPRDNAEIDGLVQVFFRLFCNRAGTRLDLGRIFDLFVPQGLLVKCGGPKPEIFALQEFIDSRQSILTNGRLEQFEEFETAQSTTIFGDCAQRLSAYTKSGVLDGNAFSTRGMKTFQLIRSEAGWKILSVAWDDEREGFAIVNADSSILWRRVDRKGHEHARLERQGISWLLSGVAVFHDKEPCRLDYVVTCDSSWSTTDARVTGWVGARKIESTIAVDANGLWQLNGAACPDVRGCKDVDLNFTPATNLLPIRRLSLAIGQSAEVRAAWLRFPSFTLEPLDQVYTRVSERRYRYESSTGFVAEIDVNDAGLPVLYGDVWSAAI